MSIMLLTTVGACRGGAPQQTSEPAAPQADTGQPPAAAVAGTEPTGTAGISPPAGPEATSQPSVRRTVTLEQAAQAVEFELRAPAMDSLPEGTELFVIWLEEPIEGQGAVPGLPAVSMIFQLAAGPLNVRQYRGPSALHLSGAREVTVGSVKGEYASLGVVEVLRWQVEGITYELRTNQLTQDELIEIANSFVPAAEALDAAPAPLEPAATPTSG